MNGQTARLEIAREIMELCGIGCVIETGTFLGSTTEWFAQFAVPVISVEIMDRNYGYARERLKGLANVALRHANSVDVLGELAREGHDRALPTLFYLDAHWYEHLPLREELEIIFGNFDKAVILVDDFQVPDDPGYGYDDYGHGKALTLDYLKEVRMPPLQLYFPRTAARWETGAKKGSLVATGDMELMAALDQAPLLRRWQPVKAQAE